jgi:hypothetical protein
MVGVTVGVGDDDCAGVELFEGVTVCVGVTV